MLRNLPQNDIKGLGKGRSMLRPYKVGLRWEDGHKALNYTVIKPFVIKLIRY